MAYSENVTGLSIGDIANIVKKGHQYAWIAYKDAEDSGKPSVQPLAGAHSPLLLLFAWDDN